MQTPIPSRNRPKVCLATNVLVAAAVLIAAACVPAQTTSFDEKRELARKQAADWEKGAPQRYRSNIEFLADPVLEGRGPGTKGNRAAADYLEGEFRKLGLQEPFVIAGGKGSSTDRSYRSTFAAGNNATQKLVELRGHVGAGEDRLGDITEGIRALGFSASSEVAAPIVFVGYSIEQGGPDKAYSSFPKDAGDKPLEGKIAMILRFEPMDAKGVSLWKKKEDTLWSAAAALPDKITAAISRGAAGIILASPPGCEDPRTKKLESAEATTRWMRTLDVPAVMMSAEAADTLVRARDPGQRTLLQLREIADKEGGSISLGSQPVKLAVTLDRTPRTTWNIAGTLPGRGPLKDQYIIIGAHYDHVGYGYTGGSRSDEYGIIHPGADDNASGTAGLLLAAETLAARRRASPDTDTRSILFVAFSAEEMGLIGSREFMKACPIDAKNIDAMLNMDMIGRLRANKLELSGTGTAEGFMGVIQPQLTASGLNIQASPGGRGPSDHATFYGAGIPVLHFFTGNHEQYHTPRDTVDLINVEGAVKVVNLVCDIAETLAKREQQLTFVSTDKKLGGKGEPDEPGKPQITLGGVKVRFGIAPGNYADGEAGILVGEVYPGTCAAEAGIQPSDRLIRWNGKEIGDVQSWMTMLSQHKPGDIVDVDLKRGKEELRVRATLKSRDQAPK